MCYEDVKLGRQFKSRIHTTDSSITIPGNGKRIGFWLSANESQGCSLDVIKGPLQLTIAFVDRGRTDLGGSFSTPPVFIGLQQVGDLIFGTFRLLSVLGTGNVAAVEIYLDDGPDFKP